MNLQKGGMDLVKCPSCEAAFAFEPESKPNYDARDEKGQKVSKKVAEHMA